MNDVIRNFLPVQSYQLLHGLMKLTNSLEWEGINNSCIKC